MKSKKVINKGVWIFALIILILALAGCITTLLWGQWKQAICYFLIFAGMSMLLYNNRKQK